MQCKINIIIGFTWLLPFNIISQNTIFNPSFEDTISCPPYGSLMWEHIKLAKGWFQPDTSSENYSSTDLFHSCSYSSNADVPNNFAGYQYAHTGEAYCGIILFAPYSIPANYREYIETKLSESLKQGKKYCVSFYISLSDDFRFSTRQIGAFFSTDSVFASNSIVLPYIPQVVYSGAFMTDTSIWYSIYGEFVATGGEQFITIGNFKDDNNTDSIVTNPNAAGKYAYIYIDDVSVTLCDSVNVVERTDKDPHFSIYPNPNNGSMQLDYRVAEMTNVKLVIYDMKGISVASYLLSQNKSSLLIDNRELQNGVYFYRIFNDGIPTTTKKLIIIR